MKVLLTVDVEIWLDDWNLGPASFRNGFDRFILGGTGSSKFGIPYQLELLREHGLNGVFFVEPLFACHFGLPPLRDIVAMIRDGGQEVQLHLHTEWNGFMRAPIVPGKHGINLRDFDSAEQLRLITVGRDNLVEAGAPTPNTFRAGNFGANRSSLGALKQAGIEFDSSFDLAGSTGPFMDQRILCPTLVDGIKEIPIAVFRTWLGQYRHAQVGAASFEEIRAAMLRAYDDGWPAFVIFWHSAELLDGSRTRANDIAIHRMSRLCNFLAEQRQKFETVGFGELSGCTDLYGHPAETPPRIPAFPTMRRQAEQFRQRFRS